MEIKKIFKVLFHPTVGLEERINLFKEFPLVKRFFYQRKNFALIRTFGDLIFLVLILMGLFGPQEPSQNIMLFLSWGVWWTSVVLSWFFLGRMWCALCPFPGLARLFQHFKFSFFKEPGSFIKKYALHLATILFFVIIWLETTTTLTQSPRYTALFLLTIVFLAGLLGIIYREYAWCRYLCPLGRITGVASVMALIEFRANYKICQNCKEAYCRKGREKIKPCPVYLGAVAVQNNLNCFICGHCVILCPKDSPSIYLRNPLKEIILNKGRGLTCALIIPFLIGSQLARFFKDTSFFSFWQQEIGFPSNFLFTIVFLWLSISLIIITKLAASYFRYIEDPLLGKFNLAVAILIPMAFTGEVIYRLEYFLKNLGNFLPTLGRQFNLLSLLDYYFEIPLIFIKTLSIFLLTFSLLGGFYLIFYFYFIDFEREIPFKRYLPFVGILIGLYFLYFFFIFTSI